MGSIIAVVSGKGGTGKTTAVGAIGACLGALGRRTLCADCDADLQNLDITLGSSGYLLPSVSSLSALPEDIGELCMEHPSLENVWLLSPLSFSGKTGEDLYPALFEDLRSRFDFCLLDAPAGIGDDVLRLLTFADQAIIVATGDRSSLRDAQVMCAKLQDYGLSDVRLLVNRVRSRAVRRDGMSVDEMIDTVGARLLGVVQEDDDVPAAANREVPLVLFSRRKASHGFLRVARRLTGEDVPIPVR